MKLASSLAPGERTKKIARNYSDRTLKLLWGRAAGHCAMAECRVELFAEATDYDPIVVIGEMGHVAAASDDGPRARAELSAAERNKYENLILLCQNCHEKLDGQPGFYTDERLRHIKQAHEAWVRASLPECGRSSTGWTVLGLQGDRPIDLASASEALSPDFILDDTQMLQVPTNAADWQGVDAAIFSKVQELLSGRDVCDRRLAIFPLAPVSACLSLGYHLTSRPHVRLFQNHRDQRNWVWPRRPAPAQDIAVSGVDGSVSDDRSVAFLFHFSAGLPGGHRGRDTGVNASHPISRDGSDHGMAGPSRPSDLGVFGGASDL